MNLSWHRRRRSIASADEPRPIPWPAPHDYVLAEHPRLGVCCVTECADGFGVLWSWSGGRWVRHDGSLVEPTRTPAQSFRGAYDPSLDRILCFGLEMDDVGSHGVVVSVSESGAAREHDNGVLPVGPAHATHDFGCIFGVDLVRGVCAVLGEERVWERDAHGRWRVAAEVAPGCTTRQWYPGSHDAAYDARRGQLVFYWLDFRDLSPRLVGWSGSTLESLSIEGLPRRYSKRGGGALAAHPEHGVVLVFGGAGIFARGDDGTWSRVGDADLRRFDASRALYESATAALWLGPGTFDSPAGHPRDERGFHRDDVGIGPRWLGPGSASRRRLLAWHGTELLDLGADWAATANGGELWAIATDGALYCRRGDTWQPLAPAHADLAGAIAVAAAACVDGLIAVAARADGERVTLGWDGACWRELAREAPSRKSRQAARRMTLVDDRRHDRALRYDGGDALELTADGWARFPSHDVGGSERRPIAVQDQGSGRVLVLRVDVGRVFAVERDGAREVATLEPAPDDLEPDAWHLDRPLAADWSFDPTTRELTLWVDDELDQRFVIELGPVFDRI